LPGFRDPVAEDVYLIISVSEGNFRESKEAGLPDDGGGVEVDFDDSEEALLFPET
jgi:hypothetical protein